ncbi:MAG: hypothetical protein ACFFCP_03975 [Promethearchaeota archaeon]
MAIIETVFNDLSAADLTMKTGYHAATYSHFEESFNTDIKFSTGQQDVLQNGESVILTLNQLNEVIDSLDSDSYIATYANSLSPLSMSLYVINDTLWKMMEKKLWDPDKMLAMTTFPLCAWDAREEKASNPKGVKRGTVETGRISFSDEPDGSIIISGEGGDFCGFIERSHLTARKWGVPESRKLIPNYVYCEAIIKVNLHRASLEIHPTPRDMLDYDFSDSARVFHNHGALLTLPGEDLTLSIEGRNPSKLKGEVQLLFGTRADKDKEEYRALLADLWLGIFARRIG